MYKGVLYRNWHNLYPINIVKNRKELLKYVLIFLGTVAIFIDWKNCKKKWFSGLLLIIAITPYIRYLILANHSYRHSFFTFREQIISCIAVMGVVLENLNYKLLFKEIRWRRDGRNRVNNTNAMFK